MRAFSKEEIEQLIKSTKTETNDTLGDNVFNSSSNQIQNTTNLETRAIKKTSHDATIVGLRIPPVPKEILSSQVDDNVQLEDMAYRGNTNKPKYTDKNDTETIANEIISLSSLSSLYCNIVTLIREKIQRGETINNSLLNLYEFSIKEQERNK